MYLACYGTTTLTAPSGWSTIVNEDGLDGSNNITTAIFRKVADGSDIPGSNKTFDAGASASGAQVGWVCWAHSAPTGVDYSVSTPDFVTSGTTKATPASSPGINPTAEGDHWVFAVGMTHLADETAQAGYTFVNSDPTTNATIPHLTYNKVTFGASDVETPGAWAGTGWGFTLASLAEGTSPVLGGDIVHDDLDGRDNDDNHPHYILVDGTRAFTGVVTGVAPTSNLHLATKKYVDDTASGGGGGGKSYIAEPPMAPSGSAHADDDEFDQANGTDPTTNGWAWSNQTGVTAVVRHGRVLFDARSSSSRGNHGLYKAFPGSGDVTIAARVGHNAIVANHSMGIAFLWGTLATPTRIEHARYFFDGNVYWSHVGVTNRGNFLLAKGIQPYVRLEWKDSGTTVQAFWSTSPNVDADWRAIAAASNVSAGVRPDFYGVSIEDATSGATLPHGWASFFRVNWTPDFDASTDI
jgi:hypothetical protein